MGLKIPYDANQYKFPLETRFVFYDYQEDTNKIRNK